FKPVRIKSPPEALHNRRANNPMRKPSSSASSTLHRSNTILRWPPVWRNINSPFNFAAASPPRKFRSGSITTYRSCLSTVNFISIYLMLLLHFVPPAKRCFHCLDIETVLQQYVRKVQYSVQIWTAQFHPSSREPS